MRVMSPRRLALVVGLVALAAFGTWAVVLRPDLGASAPAGGASSTVAGQTVPPLLEPPIARIAIAGDTGTGDAAEAATAERIISESRSGPYDALILLGDLVYPDGDAARVDRTVTEPFAPLVDSGTELLPVLGNHDYESGEQGQILTELGRTSSWYTAAIGAVRVLVVDSNQIRDDQTQWLRAALAEPQPLGTWTLVAMHHPAYSAGMHGSDATVQKAWVPLFAEAGVDLVLAGHDHDYQRSTPQDGVTYIVSGAGAKLRATGHEDFTAVSASTLHYVDLLVYDDRLVGRAIDQSGRLVDTFTITR